MRISDWSSDVCSSDLYSPAHLHDRGSSALCCSAGAICPPLHENEFCRTERAASPQYPQALSPTILGLGQIVFNPLRSEEHTSELQSLMRISYAAFCLKKKKHPSHHLRTK